MLEHKSGNISETRKERIKIEEKLLWRAYRKSQTLFRTVPSRPPTASPSPRLRVRNPTPKLQSLLSQEQLKLGTSNLAGIFTGSIRTKALKNLGEKGAWAYPGSAKISWVPSIISGTGKGTNFQFCTCVLSVDRNKRPLQISGKSSRGLVRTLTIFRDTHIFGDSSAVLLLMFLMINSRVNHKINLHFDRFICFYLLYLLAIRLPCFSKLELHPK